MYFAPYKEPERSMGESPFSSDCSSASESPAEVFS
jgi:hypothetical protein